MKYNYKLRKYMLTIMWNSSRNRTDPIQCRINSYFGMLIIKLLGIALLVIYLYVDIFDDILVSSETFLFDWFLFLEKQVYCKPAE